MELGHPALGFRGAEGTSWGKRNFLRAVTSKQDWWEIGGGVLWAPLMSPPTSICSLSPMEIGSRGGAPGAQLSTHGTPCFLNLLDTPTQEEPPASLGCGTLAECCSPWAAASSYAGHILAAV